MKSGLDLGLWGIAASWLNGGLWLSAASAKQRAVQIQLSCLLHFQLWVGLLSLVCLRPLIRRLA